MPAISVTPPRPAALELFTSFLHGVGRDDLSSNKIDRRADTSSPIRKKGKRQENFAPKAKLASNWQSHKSAISVDRNSPYLEVQALSRTLGGPSGFMGISDRG